MDQGHEVKTDPRRELPAVDRLVAAASAAGEVAERLPPWSLRAAARRVLARERASIASGRPPPGLERLAAATRSEAAELARPHPCRVINATGVLLHTNLGRAPLGAGAVEAAARAAGYCDLELDLSSGRRGQRLARVTERLRLLAGAEDALAVNNNAAAVLLAAAALARGRQAIVSRGELVEIGGSFRIPEVLEAAGVELVEVGTTNRTRLEDYRRALSTRTGLLLKVHRSNFELRGFVAEVPTSELVPLAREAGLPLLEDLGSATLVDLRAHGLPEESFAPARLRQGPDLVCFSGDKLLGGPQAGIVLGRADLVEAMRRHPLARALRLDKLSLAALDWTLGALLAGRARELPLLRQLLASPGAVLERARRLADRWRARLGSRWVIDLEPTRAPIGGGSFPGTELASWAVRLRGEAPAERAAEALRRSDPPVVVRVREGALLLDLRTVLPEEEAALERAVVCALASGCD